ncbi:plasmid replication initiator RepA, partial [Escherichia coli]
MADLLQKYYSQVKNPNPVFTPREGAGTLKFCEKLMEKAVGFTSRFDFAIHVAHARSKGLRRRMPPVLRRRAIDALLQGLCFHYDPLANRVQCSITTLAIECGLATESAAGKLSITRASRALTFLAELGLITGTVAKLAMRQPFVLFKGLTFQKLCLPGAFRPGD